MHRSNQNVKQYFEENKKIVSKLQINPAEKLPYKSREKNKNKLKSVRLLGERFSTVFNKKKKS
jgi:hypothetical protein